MSSNTPSEMQEPSIDTDKLSYEIFSILESKFLFGYDDNQKLWIPKPISPPASEPMVQPGDENSFPAIKNQRGKICILSIDSGGMKGILCGKALAYLEKALKSKDNNQPIFTAEETWRFLADNGKRIYRSGAGKNGGILKKILKNGSTGSSSNGMEKAMKEAFTAGRRSLTLKDTLKPVLIPCYDLSSTAPFLFSRADALETDSFDFPLWEVCRATSAEPGLSGPVLMQSVDGQTKCVAVDGGLAMSNPTVAAITHVLHNKQEFPFVRGVEDLLVLSLGTGQLLEVSYEYEQVKNWRLKDWAKPMARISGDGSADSVDQTVAMAFQQCRSSNYVRIQANGSSLGRCGPNVDTDPSPSNVKLLMEIGEEMLKQKNVESILFGGKRISEESNMEKLDWFAGELVLEHQRRSCRIAPTVAFKQPSPKIN
ncbi:hypothetical protein Goklo_002098 [Gossypium klotzschianum]|uniref:Patatin n=1 Tax=Gossypium klotzschianum TaxID=34286 RepID=A0A7J8VT52_9ROSI|nr:hypothetical protein [Gossypium klotzschianum]